MARTGDERPRLAVSGHRRGRTGVLGRLERADGRFGAPLAVVIGGAVSAALAALAGRADGAAGAGLATVVVLLFFATGAVPLLLVGSPAAAGVGILVLLMSYLLRLVAVFAVLGLARASAAVDVRWLALTLIALSLVWVGAQVAVFTRSRPSLDL